MGQFPGEFENTLTQEARELGYPERKWTETELRAMRPEMARKFLPEAARQLYLGTPTIFLDSPVPLERNPSINENHEKAGDLLRVTIFQAQKLGHLSFASVVGGMAGGKSTVAYEAVADTDRNFPLPRDWTFAIFKQTEQVKFDGKRIITHGLLEFPEVEEFTTIFDIPAKLNGKPCPEVIIAEEVQFAFMAGKPSEQRSGETIRQEIKGFLEVARQMGVKAVIFTSLDRDFRGLEWPHTRPMLSLVDLNLVVTARCTDCNGIAYFTQRDVFENGVWRPARMDEDVVVAGNVGESRVDSPQRYQPKCSFCHQVLPPLHS